MWEGPVCMGEGPAGCGRGWVERGVAGQSKLWVLRRSWRRLAGVALGVEAESESRGGRVGVKEQEVARAWASRRLRWDDSSDEALRVRRGLWRGGARGVCGGRRGSKP